MQHTHKLTLKKTMCHNNKRCNGTEEFIYRAAKEKQTENQLMDTGRGERRGEMYEESHMETYVTICKIDSQLNWLHN